MMILAMLEEGKITSEEAIKLLEALEDIDMPSNSNKTDEAQNESSQEKLTLVH